MDKTVVMAELEKEKIVAVIRGDNGQQVEKIVDAVYKGGIKFVEITFTIPRAETIIANMVEKYKDHPDVIIGAGTCLDIVAARMAISAGASFVVSPHFDKDIMMLCNSYCIPYFAGAATLKEMMECLRYGGEVIKLFPGDIFGPKAIKAFHGPLPQAKFMPTGGVSKENIKEWLENGAIAVGTGSSLCKGVATGDFDAITKEAQSLVDIVKEYVNQ